jgi:hypothetical protein
MIVRWAPDRLEDRNFLEKWKDRYPTLWESMFLLSDLEECLVQHVNGLYYNLLVNIINPDARKYLSDYFARAIIIRRKNIHDYAASITQEIILTVEGELTVNLGD